MSSKKSSGRNLQPLTDVSFQICPEVFGTLNLKSAPNWMQNVWDRLKEFLITHKQTLRISKVCIKYAALAGKNNLKVHCIEYKEIKWIIMFSKE